MKERRFIAVMSHGCHCLQKAAINPEAAGDTSGCHQEYVQALCRMSPVIVKEIVYHTIKFKKQQPHWTNNQVVQAVLLEQAQPTDSPENKSASKSGEVVSLMSQGAWHLSKTEMTPEDLERFAEGANQLGDAYLLSSWGLVGRQLQDVMKELDLDVPGAGLQAAEQAWGKALKAEVDDAVLTAFEGGCVRCVFVSLLK